MRRKRRARESVERELCLCDFDDVQSPDGGQEVNSSYGKVRKKV